MKKFEELKELVSNIENDAVKFYGKGNKAAGKRLRNGLQRLKAIASDVRKEVTLIKNAE